MSSGFVDMPDTEYHAHPALSYSNIKLLLPPNCPARYAWQLNNPRPTKRCFDFGHAAHRYVLGKGAALHRVEADSYRTKAAQSERDAAHADGLTPILAAEDDKAQAMAAAALAHPIAGPLLRADGITEQAMFWDDEYGPMRGRPDKIVGRYLIDYKTCASADPARFARTIADHGYDIQDVHYRRGAAACGIRDPQFVLIAQEKEPPFLVAVVQLQGDSLRSARALAEHAYRIHRDCTATGVWPGYTDTEPAHIDTPVWHHREIEEITA